MTRHPLSQTQQLMWMGQQRFPDSALYTMAMTFTIDGELDASVFAGAFDQLVLSEDVLRMTIVADTQSPAVVYRDDVPLALQAQDLRHLSDSATINERLNSVIQQRCRARIDMHECSYDSVLLRTDDAQWVWFLAIHHLACDIASFSLLLNRMSTIYQRLADRNLAHSEVTPGPAFSDWLAAEDDKPRADSPGALPSDAIAAMSPAATTASERLSFSLDAAHQRALISLTQRLDAFSANSVLLAVLNVVTSLLCVRLHGLSDQGVAQDETHADCAALLIGAPLGVRADSKARAQCGPLLHMATLVATVDQRDTAFDNIARALTGVNAGLRRELARSSAHSARALTESSLQQATRVTAINNVIVETFPAFDGKPCYARWWHCAHHDAAHPLRIHAYRLNEGDDLTIAIDMNRSVFDSVMRRALPAMVESLLTRMLDETDVSLAALSVGGEDTVGKALLRHTQSSQPQCSGSLLDDFLRQCELTPQATALQIDDDAIDYATLQHAVNACAAQLTQAGVGKGSRVLVCIARSARAVVALLAIWRCGAAFVPVDVRLPVLRFKAMLNTLQTADDASVFAVSSPATEAPVVAALTESGVKTISLASPIKHGSVPGEFAQTAVAPVPFDDTALAYVLFTSGSTGEPKGVCINHRAIANYIRWARTVYVLSRDDIAHVDFAHFTSLSVDLTLTSILLPLTCGGTVHVYAQPQAAFDTLVRDVVAQGRCNFIKLTPSHLDMLSDESLTQSHLQCVIVGGERWSQASAARLQNQLGEGGVLYNEYGPTEATVGCIVHRYKLGHDTAVSVPIGQPIWHTQCVVVDRNDQPVPRGVRGELLLCGAGLADGYLGDDNQTARRFVTVSPAISAEPLPAYRSGDLVSIDDNDVFHYHGRIDSQVKLRGVRLEIGEIEAALLEPDWVSAAAARVISSHAIAPQNPARCAHCALPENYPQADLDHNSVCAICRRFELNRTRVEAWFGDIQTLVEMAQGIRARYTQSSNVSGRARADCVALYSGGKDSTYMLYRLKALGLTPLVLTLDNGYLSQHALANVQRTLADLDLPHRVVSTPSMDRIFVDSLVQHANVCNGCFKTIYTLALNEADKEGLDVIFTGLSRGQLFETRLDDLYDRDNIDVAQFDDVIHTARQTYHAMDDEVNRCLGRGVIEKNLLEKIQFVDFYRYVDVPLDEVMAFLSEQTPWRRPPDTGRSTNCLINEAGIFVHKNTRGFHNYDLPYSWDVRIGHKTREQALDELTEDIDADDANALLAEIGYTLPTRHDVLIAGVVTQDGQMTQDQREQLKAHLSARLPEAAWPGTITALDTLPLAHSGKLDEATFLRLCQSDRLATYRAPQNPMETQILAIWTTLFAINDLGTADDFFALGGDSLLAVRLVMALREGGITVSPTALFEYSTVTALAEHVQQNVGLQEPAAEFNVDSISAIDITLSDTELSDIARDLE